MDEKTFELFNDSFGVCQSNPDFIAKFYKYFLASSPKVQEKFANTDFSTQNRMLQASLYMVMVTYQGGISAEKHLEMMAERHSRRGLTLTPSFMSFGSTP